MSTKITRTALGLGAAAVLTFGLAACHGSSGGGGTSSSPSGSSGGGAATSSAMVDVKGFAFNPSTVTVKTGGKVTWKFEDSAPHNVSFQSLNKTSPDEMNGGSYSMTFSKAGTYNYLCTIHSFMTAKVVVK